MHQQVRNIPARRGAAAGELQRDIDVGDEIELHAAPPPGLHKAQQPARMQLGHGFGRHRPLGFAAGGALAQGRHETARALERLVI
jgi:hypothetical protein